MSEPEFSFKSDMIQNEGQILKLGRVQNLQIRASTWNACYQIIMKCFDVQKDIWYGGTVNTLNDSEI